MNISIGMMVIHPKVLKIWSRPRNEKKMVSWLESNWALTSRKKTGVDQPPDTGKQQGIQKFQKHQPLITWIYPQRRELNMAMDFNFENL